MRFFDDLPENGEWQTGPGDYDISTPWPGFNFSYWISQESARLTERAARGWAEQLGWPVEKWCEHYAVAVSLEKNPEDEMTVRLVAKAVVRDENGRAYVPVFKEKP